MGAMTAKDGKLEQDGEDPLQIVWPLTQMSRDQYGKEEVLPRGHNMGKDPEAWRKWGPCRSEVPGL